MATYTNAEVLNLLESMHTRFTQDITDSEHTSLSPQAITAGTEYVMTIDGLERNFVSAPSFFSDRWDSTNNKMTFIDAINTQNFVADISMTYNPSNASAARVTIRVYVDGDTPALLRTYSAAYKGTAETINKVCTFYTGTETGYDVKNDGVYVTLEFDSSGELYGKGMVIYHT